MVKTNIKQEGFTLIELLVVIAIIGLLSTLSIVALNSARVKSRDAQRTASIKQWQTALELYYSDMSGYPPKGSSTPGGVLTRHGVLYLGKIPQNTTPWTGGACTSVANAAEFSYDPLDSAGAASVGDNAVTYTISYCLEGGAGGVTAGPHKATPAGIQ